MENINIKDYILNENWNNEMKIAVEKSMLASKDINSYSSDFSKDEEGMSAVGYIRSFIKALKADIKLFSYYKDYLKDSYELMNEIVYFCPQTYSEQQKLDADKLKHEELFNELQERLTHLETNTEIFNKRFEAFMKDNDLSAKVTKGEAEEISNMSIFLSTYRTDCYGFATLLMDYVQNVKNDIVAQLQEYDEISNADKCEEDNNQFIS